MRFRRQRAIVLFLTAVLILQGTLSSQEQAGSAIVSVSAERRTARRILALGLDLLLEREGRIFIVAAPNDLLKLEEAAIPYRMESFLQMMQITGLAPAGAEGGRNGDFHSYLELEADLRALESAYPSLAKVFDIGDSLEKRNIYALKISDNVGLDEDEAEVSFLGCHHAREWISVEVPFLVAKHLLENYGSDPEVKDFVDNSELWFVPLVNPDGLEYSIHVYRYWRKNRRDNKDGTYGVDLNRNYGFQWGLDDEGSSPEPSSQVYRGTAPFSEPESRAVRDLFARKRFQAVVTYHNYTQIILFPWGYTSELSPAFQEHNGMAADMSALMEEVNGRLYGYGQAGEALYTTNGDTTDWAYGIFGIPAFTIELPPPDVSQGGFFNAEEEIQPIFRENLPAALFLIRYAIDTFVPGQGDGSPEPGRKDRPRQKEK